MLENNLIVFQSSWWRRKFIKQIYLQFYELRVCDGKGPIRRTRFFTKRGGVCSVIHKTIRRVICCSKEYGEIIKKHILIPHQDSYYQPLYA